MYSVAICLAEDFESPASLKRNSCLSTPISRLSTRCRSQFREKKGTRRNDLRLKLKATMMSRNNGPHHNIWTERLGAPGARSRIHLCVRYPHEAGYTLVALLALMTILALFAAAAAPSLRQQALREKEKE